MDLSDENRKIKYSEEECRKYFRQLVEAVNYSMYPPYHREASIVAKRFRRLCSAPARHNSWR